MTTTDENQTTVTEQPAIAALSEAMPTDERSQPPIAGGVVTDIQYAELLQKIRNSLSKFQVDFLPKRPVVQEIQQESQVKFTEIMGIINHRLQQAEADRAKFEAEIVALRSNLSAAESEINRLLKQIAAVQSEKTAIEADLKKAAAESQMWEQEKTQLKSELVKANALVEAAVAEKNKFEKKLNQFQEQWDKYVAGS
jgi:chromosome segregation ATPase